MAAKDHVAVRLDPATLDRVDIMREVLSTDWHEATQSDALRALILSGLKLLEKEHATRIAEVKKRRDASPPPEKGGPPPEKGGPPSKRGKRGK